VGALAAHLLVVKEGNQADVRVILQASVGAAADQGLDGAEAALEVVKPGREDEFLQCPTDGGRLGVCHTELKVADCSDWRAQKERERR